MSPSSEPFLWLIVLAGGPFRHPLTLVFDHLPHPDEAEARIHEFKGIADRDLIGHVLSGAVKQLTPPAVAPMIERAANGSLDVTSSFNSSRVRGLQFTFQVVLRP